MSASPASASKSPPANRSPEQGDEIKLGRHGRPRWAIFVRRGAMMQGASVAIQPVNLHAPRFHAMLAGRDLPDIEAWSSTLGTSGRHRGCDCLCDLPRSARTSVLDDGRSSPETGPAWRSWESSPVGQERPLALQKRLRDHRLKARHSAQTGIGYRSAVGDR